MFSILKYHSAPKIPIPHLRLSNKVRLTIPNTPARSDTVMGVLTKKHREQQMDGGRYIDLLSDDQIPTDPDALHAVTGNRHVDVRAALLESAQSTRPKLVIKARIAETRIKDMDPLSKASFKAVISLLKSAHGKHDFEAKLVQLQKTITHVDSFLPDTQINGFIRSQEESEVVTEFRRANPEKEAELVKLSRQQYALEHVLSSLQPEPSKEGLQSLCATFGIAPWPDLRLYPSREDVQQSLKPHQVEGKFSLP